MSKLMAERMGFEPMIELPLYTLSKRAPSTTRPPLQKCFNYKLEISIKLFNKRVANENIYYWHSRFSRKPSG